MSAFVEVTRDLWIFVTRAESTALPTRALVSNPTLQEVKERAQQPVVTPQIALSPDETASVFNAGAEVYTLIASPLHLFPTRMLDGVMRVVPFGTRCTVVQQRQGWLEVSLDDQVGWLQDTTVTDKKSVVEPVLVSGVQYEADNQITRTIRVAIADEFAAGVLDQPLQSIEYVWWRITKERKRVVWPAERPRIAGRWQKILRGTSGIHIGIHPKTGSVMEVIETDGEGKIWFVDAVFPDQAVRVSSVSTEGIFTAQTISAQHWREQRPVFISFT